MELKNIKVKIFQIYQVSRGENSHVGITSVVEELNDEITKGLNKMR